MFALNILQLRPADDIYLPPSRPSSARGRAHRPPPSFPSSSLVIPSIHLDPPPPHLSPYNAPDGSEGFLFYFDPSCAKARKLEAEVDTLTRGRRAPLVTRHLSQATHVLVDPTSSFGERFFQDRISSLGSPFLLDLRWITDSFSSVRWQHETDYLYHPLVSNSVLATLFPEEEPSASMVLASTSILLDDANEVEDIPVEPVQEVELAMESLEEDEPRVVTGVEEEAEAVARVGSEGGDESGDEDEDVSNPPPSNHAFFASEEPSDHKFATFLHALGPNVTPWVRNEEGWDTFDLYVRIHPNQTADWWRTRWNKEIKLFIILLNALRSQPSHEVEEVEADPSSAQSMDTGVSDGSQVEIREEAANTELPLEDDEENEELEETSQEPAEMEAEEPISEEVEFTLSIETLEEMFLEMRSGLERNNPVLTVNPVIVASEVGKDVQLSPEVDVANEREDLVEKSNQVDTVELVDLFEDIEPMSQLEIQKETKEPQQKLHHSPFSSNSSSSSSTPSSSTHSVYSTPGSSPSPSSRRTSSRSPGPSSPKRRRLASREASNPPPPIVDASESDSLPLSLLPSPLSPSPSPSSFTPSPRSRQTLSSSLSPPPELPPPKPFEPPSFLELGVPSSFLPSSSSFAPTCFFCGFEAKSNKSIQRNPICLPCFDWLDKKIDERGDSVKEVEALEDGGRLAWALCMWKVNGLRERRGRVRKEDGGTMVVEWRGGEL